MEMVNRKRIKDDKLRKRGVKTLNPSSHFLRLEIEEQCQIGKCHLNQDQITEGLNQDYLPG